MGPVFWFPNVTFSRYLVANPVDHSHFIFLPILMQKISIFAFFVWFSVSFQYVFSKGFSTCLFMIGEKLTVGACIIVIVTLIGLLGSLCILSIIICLHGCMETAGTWLIAVVAEVLLKGCQAVRRAKYNVLLPLKRIRIHATPGIPVNIKSAPTLATGILNNLLRRNQVGTRLHSNKSHCKRNERTKERRKEPHKPV